MNVIVDDQTKKFYLAFNDKWLPVVGHEIQIGKYRFCAIAQNKVVNISEVTSGAKVLEIPLSFPILLLTETKEDTLQFYKKVVGERLQKIITHNSAVFDEKVKKIRQEVVARLGEMPPIRVVDTAWLEANISDNPH